VIIGAPGLFWEILVGRFSLNFHLVFWGLYRESAVEMAAGFLKSMKTARIHTSDIIAEFAALGTNEEYEAVLSRMIKQIEDMENEKGIEYNKTPKVGERYMHANLFDKQIWTVRHVTGQTPGFPVSTSDVLVLITRKGRSVPGGVEYLVLPVVVFLEDFEQVTD